MNNKIFENPDNLENYGFDREDDGTSDMVRWVYFKKEIPVSKTGYKFIIKVTYELTIFDDPEPTYDENCSFHYERTECFLHDADGNEIFETMPRIKSLGDFDTVEYFFRR